MFEFVYFCFFVISEDKDYIEGILLVKDFLVFVFNVEKEFNFCDILCFVVIVLESKCVDVLFKEFC